MTTFAELRRETVAMLEPLAEEFLFPQSDSETRKTLSLQQESWEFAKAYHEKESAAENDPTWKSCELFELQKCDKEATEVLGKLRTSKAALQELMGQYRGVAERTSSLHEACDQLMADQTRLASAAEDIRSKLSYFDHVEQLTQKLSSTHLSVTGESFAHILSTIDECMQFLQDAKDYKESGLYLSKYQQCLSRALSMVKSHVVSNLTAAKTSIQEKLGGDGGVDDTFTLYYGVFATHAQTIHGVMEKLEHKWDRNTEYQSVLSDCYQAYFSQRNALLKPSVSATIQQLLKKHSGSCCTLTRTGCSFLLRLCEDEYRLFFQFFTRPTELLHDFLERMCRIFYDSVRPLIIHIPHLETLGELCSILKIEMLEERCAVESDVYDGFVRVVSELVGDAGERLVYRAHMYAQSDILGYHPAPGDLAYPEKLQMMQDIAKSTTIAQQQQQGFGGHSRQPSISSMASSTSAEVAGITEEAKPQNISAADLHGLWYPTVRRTVLCLSKLYRCLDVAVFQGLAQDILSLCVQSLFMARDKILQSKKALDAQLFLVKHLLILREQTSPFRTSMSFKETSVDFSKLKDSAYNFMNQKSRWFSLGGNNAFLELLFQAPAHVLETVVDSRRVLDLQLRDACQTFIQDSGNSVILELADFFKKADVIVQMGKHETPAPAEKREGESPSVMALRQQPFAAPPHLKNLVSQAYRKLKDFIPKLRTALSLYIGNKDTENILYAPIRKNIHSSFQKFSELVSGQYLEEEQQVIGCPSMEQVNLLLAVNPSDQ